MLFQNFLSSKVEAALSIACGENINSCQPPGTGNLATSNCHSWWPGNRQKTSDDGLNPGFTRFLGHPICCQTWCASAHLSPMATNGSQRYVIMHHHDPKAVSQVLSRRVASCPLGANQVLTICHGIFPKNATWPARGDGAVRCTGTSYGSRLLCHHGVLILVQYMPANIPVEHVHRGRGKFPGVDTLLEEQIQLGEGATRRLGHAEECVDDAEDAYAGLEPRSANGPWYTDDNGDARSRAGKKRLTQKKPA